MVKIIDCVTFFDENYIFDFRYNVLKEYVDRFIVCESIFDHKGRKKMINFNLEKKYMENKIKHIVLEKPFPKNTNEWQNQAIQREFILENLDFANDEDYVFFSDPDEIPNPEILKNFNLKKKYGIFMQKFYNYKFNLYNKYETPWQGTRVCKKKNLKSTDYMRQKIKKKNQEYSFFRFDKERSVEVFWDAGWHFNNLMEPEAISKKLQSFAHIEYNTNEFTSPEKISQKIEKKIDLFNRNEKYDVVKINQKFPKFLRKNLDKYKRFII